jgi:hypothetical protein
MLMAVIQDIKPDSFRQHGVTYRILGLIGNGLYSRVTAWYSMTSACKRGCLNTYAYTRSTPMPRELTVKAWQLNLLHTHLNPYPVDAAFITNLPIAHLLFISLR